MERLISLLGLIVFTLIAWGLGARHKSFDKKATKRILIWGMALQFIMALLVIGIPALGIPAPLASLFELMNNVVVNILAYGDEGSRFLFGPLIDEAKVGGFVMAFRVLPTIIFFSSLMTMLYFMGILQKVVYALAWVMKRTLGTSGPETLAAAGNIFLGQTEAPLLIKPFIKHLSKSEMLCIMIGGMANVAGGVLAAYVMLLQKRMPDIAGHLITVSFMSAPASLLIAKLILPETKKVDDSLVINLKVEDENIVDAAARGASEGLELALNVAAMLIAFIGIVALTNGLLTWVGTLVGIDMSLQHILGIIFYPIAWLLGVPQSDLTIVSGLLGEKIVLNEFVAYLHLSEIASQLSDRGFLIVSYALCGFANISSIGIQVGGIGAMAPERRGDLAKLGWLALIGGNLATFMCAAIVGLLT